MATTENPFLYEAPKPKSGGLFVTIMMFLSILAGIFVFMYLFITVPKQVDGQSMEPTFHNDEFVMTNRLIQLIGTKLIKNYDYQKGDVVVFQPPKDTTLIKRVIATEGDTIMLKDGDVYVNNQKLTEPYLAPNTETMTEGFLIEGQAKTVPEGTYFLMGDNRGNSRDSRSIGIAFVERKYIKGRVSMIILPLGRLQRIHNAQPTSQ